MERQIRFAIQSNSLKKIDSEIVFQNQRDGFNYKKYINENKIKLYCTECNQELCISSSINKKLFFRHCPNAIDCELKSINFTSDEQKQINEHQKSVESKLHKHIKSKLYSYLLRQVRQIQVEKDMIFNGQRRRPDINLIDFNDRKIAIEIQITHIPYSYIFARTSFFQRNGIYVLWIISTIQIRTQSVFDLDIKYLTKYHNYFEARCIDDEVHIICHFKIVYLDNNKVKEKWVNRKILFSELKYDKESYEIYYWDNNERKWYLEYLIELSIKFSHLFDIDNYYYDNDKILSELVKQGDNYILNFKINEQIIFNNKKILYILYSLKNNIIVHFHFKTLQELVVYIFDKEPKFVLLLFAYCEDEIIDLFDRSIDRNGTIRKKYKSYMPSEEAKINIKYKELFQSIVNIMKAIKDNTF